MRALLIAAAVALLASPAHAEGPKVLSQEPERGKLHGGETVLVDDGSCPAGQIKQVTGGSDRVPGSDLPRAGAPRERVCVRRCADVDAALILSSRMGGRGCG
jgi:hypothetical protein